MKLLLEIVADELSNTKDTLLLNVEDFVVDEHIGMSVEGVDRADLINLILQILKGVIFYPRKMEFAHNWAFIFDCAYN